MKRGAIGAVLLSAAILAAGVTEAKPQHAPVPERHSGRPAASPVPLLFPDAVRELRYSPVPVIWPHLLPPVKNRGDRNVVKATTSANGYEMIVYSDNDLYNDNRSISMSALQATFSGKLSDNDPPNSAMDCIQDLMPFSETAAVAGTSINVYRDSAAARNVVGSDLAYWREGVWQITVQGSPNHLHEPPERAPEHTTLALARELIRELKLPEGNEIQKGYISGEEAPRRSLSVHWTYDNEVWYSLSSPDWGFAVEVIGQIPRVNGFNGRR